jgi:glycosyltransferase involved in cell wall biosynthesis
VGLPVYKGADLIAKTLDCLQRQTFDNFEAIISVDGGDAETAAACRPFLHDSRLRLIVHPGRLDWVGNFNWLLQQDLHEFFCYRQHDDTTSPNFFEMLLQAADKERDAAAVYCDCQYTGISKEIETVPSIRGEPLDRMLQFVERLQYPAGAALRGLIRRPAIRETGLVRSDEFRAPLQVHSWLAKLLRWGNFKRVPAPLYYRLDHAQSFTREHFNKKEDRKRAAWTTMFTGLLEAAMPLCRTPEQRLFFQQVILDRIVAYPNFRPTENSNSSGKLIVECLERLKSEGNTHLLEAEELPIILEGLNQRLDEIKLIERSRIRRGIYRIGLRYRFGKLIFPESLSRRVYFQFRHLLGMLKSQIVRVFSRRNFARS